MTNSIKKLILLFLTFAFIGAVIVQVPVIYEYAGFVQAEQQIQQTNVVPISSDLTTKERQTIEMSAQSVARILSKSPGGIASSTGTILEHDGSYYVLTTAHGILSGCEDVVVWTGGINFLPCEDILIIDRQTDYSIIKIEHPGLATPIVLEDVIPHPRTLGRVYSLQNKIYYTGFPNSVGPLTLSGRIVGFSSDGHFYTHTYAWSGSSGSGVFSHDGKLIGVVLAIDIGRTVFGVDVLEDLVIILPTSRVRWEIILGE
jgi:hypothetical protein